jgi:hypothetical protein
VRQFLGIVESSQAVEAIVGNFRHANVSIARIRLCRKVRLGQNPEQRCLAYLGQANDASFHKNSF